MPGRILKQDAQRLLADVPEEYAFWCCDGHILRNIRGLAAALATMTDETFAYHSNSEKNDFRNWVRDVIKDEKLARDLERSQNRSQAANRAGERVLFLAGKLG